MKNILFFIVFVLLPIIALPQFEESLLRHFIWRSVGPAGAGGRVVDVEVAGEFPHHIFIATASGGLWRSTNNGVSWEPIFDDQSTVSIGAIAVHPDNPDIVWVGTGEANARNSVSWGDGVYKTTDGGKSWNNMGLGDAHHIGRIIIDRRNPDTVYVAALGHLWGPNDERGLYKTTDGGRTWQHSLRLDRDTGVVDVAMDPYDSGTLYAAAYEVRRDAFSGGNPRKMTGPGSGLYKSTDGGRNWKKLAKGLPEGNLGRIGITICSSKPQVVYTIIETETTVPGPRDRDKPAPPPKKKTARDGGVFRSDDRGETWQWVNSINPRPFYYSQIRVDPNDENRVYVLGSPLEISEDGGKNFVRLRINVHVDHHDLWINPANSNHLVLGNDGGVYFSFDRGETWDFLNQMALGQFYAIDVDMRTPYYIYGGVQDYCSWGGPSATRESIGITAADWQKVMTGDGFQVRIDPTDPDILYAEAQGGRIVRHDRRTGQNTSISPQAPEGEEDYRFNWETPLHISYHDPKTLYAGGNHLFRSTDRGNSWEVLSPDLTTETFSRPDYKDGTPQKIASITTVGESPLERDMIYVGTDDGHVHVTTNGGKSWSELTRNFPGLGGARWVSRVVASRFEEQRAYATFDGHRNDDFAPYVFMTNDTGVTWKNIASNLPAVGPVRVIREDIKNPNLLFLGTEFAAFVSFDRGAHWLRLMNGLPTVAVADLVVHPRDGDLIAGTHGRSAYVMDISSLRELTEDILNKDLHVFQVKKATAFRYRVYSDDQFLGEKRFVVANPPYGATISYYIGETLSATSEDEKKVELVVTDESGTVVRELEGPREPGIQRVQWNLRYALPEREEGEGSGFRGPSRGPLVGPGVYKASVKVADLEVSVPITVEADPMLRITAADRRRRWQTLARLLPLQADVAKANKEGRSLRDQLKTLSQSLADRKDLPDELQENLQGTLEEVEILAFNLNRSDGEVLQLYQAVESSPYLPTRTQLNVLEEVETRFRNRRSALEGFTAKQIPELEQQLNKHGVARIRIDKNP